MEETGIYYGFTKCLEGLARVYKNAEVRQYFRLYGTCRSESFGDSTILSRTAKGLRISPQVTPFVHYSTEDMSGTLRLL